MNPRRFFCPRHHAFCECVGNAVRDIAFDGGLVSGEGVALRLSVAKIDSKETGYKPRESE